MLVVDNASIVSIYVGEDKIIKVLRGTTLLFSTVTDTGLRTADGKMLYTVDNKRFIPKGGT